MSVLTTVAHRPRRARRWRSRRGLLVPTAEAVAEALATIPHGAPWAWAALRVLPSIRGTRVPLISDEDLEEDGFEPVSRFPAIEMPPGVDVSFAIEADVVHIHVDQAQLDRWELTAAQVARAAMANLRRVVGMWDGKVYEDDSLDGRRIRGLEGWPHWAVTLALLPDELQRLFGSHDQLFIAPYHCNLISLPIDVDRDFAADLVDMFGTINPRSLLIGLPAFALRGGVLSTEELPGFPDDPVADGDDDWATSGKHRLADLLGW